MFFTYILRSISRPGRRYIGYTTDVAARLDKHNEGGVKSTASDRPWRLEAYIAFDTAEKAHAFERYLKTGSGRSFAENHF